MPLNEDFFTQLGGGGGNTVSPQDMGIIEGLKGLLGNQQEGPRGIFGVHGNARDILGNIFGSLSAAAGGKDVYSDLENNRKYSEGLGQFLGGDPAGLSAMGGANPKETTDFYNRYGENQGRQATARNAVEDNRRLAQIEQDKRDLATEQRLAGIFRGATEADWPQRRAIAEQYAAMRGFDLSRANIPTKYTQDWASGYDRSLVDPEKYSAQAETARHNRATESDTDVTRLVNANLGKARVQATLAGQGRTAATGARAEAGRNIRGAMTETGRQTRFDTKNAPPSNMPPRKLNDTLKDRSGKVIWTSPDGKSWSKP